MRYSWLLKCLLAFIVIFCIAYEIQGCKKEKKIAAILPSVFSTSSSVNCFLFAGVGISFSPVYTDSIPAGSTFLWKFGDSTTSIDEAPSHTYSISGSYIVTLTINNDNAHATSNTIRVLPFLGSQYTSHMAGVRSWSGSAQGMIQEWHSYGDINVQITDTMWAVQILNSGAVNFIDNTALDLITIDTINDLLIFSDCSRERNLTYYYIGDSIKYTDYWQDSTGHDGYEYFSVHSP